MANIDMQLAAATAFLQILERKLMTVEEYKKTFLQTILTSVDSKNEGGHFAFTRQFMSSSRLSLYDDLRYSGTVNESKQFYCP